MSEYLALLMFPVLLVLIFIGFPVAFSLMATTLIFGLVTFGDNLIFLLIDKIEEVGSNFVLAAVPLFVFMGSMLERSGIADRLFEAIHLWTKRLPGGLAVGTILMAILFAASTGVIGAAEAVIGLLAIPPMLKHRYNKALISGTICAGGSLGTIIPPSVVAVVIGPLANVSIGDLFMGMVFPGLLLATLYAIYIIAICVIRPEYGPSSEPSPDDPGLWEKIRLTVYALVPPLVMIFSVLGSMIMGWAAPTEAAALGALCSVGLAVFYRRFNMRMFSDALMATLRITSMIMLILLAGNMFTGVFAGTGGMMVVNNLIDALGLGPWGLLFLVLFLTLIAGFFLEWASVTLIFIPIFAPLVAAAGFDVVWFCILFMIMLQTGYLTPPMAPAIFYLRGVSPPEITLPDMYRGVIPFILLQLVVAGVVMAFPQIVLWLPSKVLGF
ncbi:TRAP transporter large permease [Pseudazoarcus pumilus]|uniref:TRAP transporter large permease protein n=1 Tax=Pseudazoarcus pumilus TaxID=2067960 RepID=A0A2I6SA67_9RHOO|nr:TRAP transporter large permease subunit [Pseudazoarcus pumilus]AUN96135.1 C4-dicarboxylate ABC transporter permease [Pseudazoarcus pumilus]